MTPPFSSRALAVAGLVLLVSCASEDARDRRQRCNARIAKLEERVRRLERTVDTHEEVLRNNGLLAADGSIVDRPAALRCRQVREGEIAVTDRGARELREAGASLWDRLEIAPAYDENLVFIGYRVRELDEGSVMHECGLREGDVIVSVNDHVLAGPGDFTDLEQRLHAEARTVLDLLAERDTATVTLRRGHEILTWRVGGLAPLLTAPDPVGGAPSKEAR